MAALVDYRLLGPFEAAADGHVLDLGGRKQRVLLAILVLSANKPVTRDVLVDRLWGDHPPEGAQHTLDVYISRLRKVLETAAGHPVVLTRSGTYVLQAEPGRIDLPRFEDLAAEGRRMLAEGEPAKAAATLQEALALWRGAPLAEVCDEPFARPEVARLEELRAHAIEDRMEAELALGHHAEVIGELGRLVEAHPLRERLAGLLMIALYRSGRQPEALAVYQSARCTLVEEFGLEPGPDLRRVEGAILEQAAWLDSPPASTPSRLPSSPISHRRPRMLVAAGAGLALAVTLGLLVGNVGGAASGATAGPDTVGIIDAGRGGLDAVVTAVGRPGGVAYGAASAWITDTADDQLLRADMGGRVIDRIPVGPGPGAVTVGGGEVWVANQLNGTVSEVNPAIGAVVASIGVGNGPAAITYGFGSVWVANETDSTMSRIAASTGAVTTIPLGASPVGLTAGYGGIWIATSAGRLLFVDPRTSRITRSLPISDGAAAVAAGGGRIWVAGSGGPVGQVDPRTGRVRYTAVGTAAYGIAFADGAVWVSAGAGRVARLDPRTGATAFLRVGNEPTLVAAAGHDVLTTVLPSAASHRGGTLTILARMSALSETTDPALAWYAVLWQMLGVTNDGLVTYRKAGGPAGDTLVPDLATAIPAPTAGGRTYTFQLRPGIRYSNGQPVRPSDIQHAIERVFVLNRGQGPAYFYTGILGADQCVRTPATCNLARGIVADDKTGTVTFHLVAPDPDFPYKLAFPFADAMAAGTPDRVLSATHIPATGPYMTSAYIPHHEWVLVRNPRFRQWSADAQPRGYPDRIVLRLDVPPGGAVTAVERSRADVLVSPAAHMQDLSTRYPNLLHTGPESATIGLVLNTRAYPFTVTAARQAVNYAIDRRRLIGLIGGSLAGQPTCQILPPALPGYQPYCPFTVTPGAGGVWIAPDLARAQRLVAASGTKGARVTVVTGAFGTAIPVMATGRYIVSVLDQVGYRASLRVLSTYTAYDKAAYDSRSDTQVSWFSWYTDFPAPSDMIDPVLTCRSFMPASVVNLNAAEFCDRQVDAQTTQAQNLQVRAPDAAEALWARIDREIVRQAPWVPIYNPRVTVLLSPRVGNYQFDPTNWLLIDQLWVR